MSEDTSAVGVPAWFVDRAFAAKAQGFRHACAACGCGVDDFGGGNHFPDCTSTQSRDPQRFDTRSPEIQDQLRGMFGPAPI